MKYRPIRNSVIILIFLWAYLILQMALSHPELPSRMASHFNASGMTDGWMDRATFYMLWIIVTAFLNVMVIGISLAVRRFPDVAINLPNRAHWLSAENRPETFRKIFSTGILMAAVITLIFVQLFQQIVWANKQQPPRLESHYWMDLILPLLVLSATIVSLWIHFRKVPASADGEMSH